MRSEVVENQSSHGVSPMDAEPAPQAEQRAQTIEPIRIELGAPGVLVIRACNKITSEHVANILESVRAQLAGGRVLVLPGHLAVAWLVPGDSLSAGNDMEAAA